MILTGETGVLVEKHYIASVVVEWMGMEHWRNDTDRGNWCTLRKTLYSVGASWMNEYGTLAEWYWQGKPEILGEKLHLASVVDEWMSMEHWWNVTDRGNWSTGRKTLYSVGGRWLNVYGTLAEWYWQGKTEVLGEKHLIASVVEEWMCMEHWWNDTDRGNWSTGRKTFYNIGGRWLNGYGALVEWYW